MLFIGYILFYSTAKPLHQSFQIAEKLFQLQNTNLANNSPCLSTELTWQLPKRAKIKPDPTRVNTQPDLYKHPGNKVLRGPEY